MNEHPRTLATYTISSACFSAIPAIYLIYPSEAGVLSVALFVNFFISLIGLGGFAVSRWRDSFFKVIQDPTKVTLAFLNPVFLTFYYVLLLLSMSRGAPALSILVAECWPLAQIWLMRFVMPDRAEIISPKHKMLAMTVVLGLIFLTNGHVEFDLFAALFAIGAALSMGMATSIKTRFVIDANRDLGCGPFEVAFLIKVTPFPLLLLAICALYWSGGMDGMSVAGPVLVGLLSMVSTIFANAGNITMRSNVSLILFSLTPIFGMVFIGLIEGIDIQVMSVCGVIVLICANILSAWPQKSKASPTVEQN